MYYYYIILLLLLYLLIIFFRCAQDLLFYTDQVPSISTQLTILASVKSASPRDKTVSMLNYYAL